MNDKLDPMFRFDPNILLTLLLWSSGASGKPLPLPTVSGVAYGQEERQVLDFWKADSEEKTPVVVYLHGGAWLSGDKGDIRKRDFGRCLEAGISVVSINYRYVTAAKEGDASPPVSWPMMDAARAVQFVKSRAADWNLDPERVAMAGTSAGACSSLWVALHDDLADSNSLDPVARQSTRLATVAVHAGQTSLDPVQMRAWTPNSDYGGHAFGFFGKDRGQAFEEFLRCRDELLPQIGEYSPIAQASADDPPVFLVYDRMPAMGERQKDSTHSANFGTGLRDKLAGLGVACELSYPHAPEAAHASMEDYLINFFNERKTGKVELPAKESFQIYLLMGQSNMAGRDRRQLEKQDDDPRVLALDADGQWKVARDPLHPKRGRTEPGEGPGISFAKAMVEAEPGVTIGLIPCAVGGSSLNRWEKGGEFYEHAVELAKKAGETGVVAGVIWHQGESDSDNEKYAASYGERLERMIGDLRRDLENPELKVVVGQLGPFIDGKKFPYAKAVREGIREVAKENANTGLADSNGLGHQGDHLHFDADSAHRLGKRYAEAMLELKKVERTVTRLGE